MDKGRLILDADRFAITMDRLSLEIIENYNDFANTCIIGIQDGGVILAEKLIEALKKNSRKKNFTFGKLDITFYRDDFRKDSHPISASTTEIDFLIEGKNVILVDDVLYTGRTIQAAMSAILDFGRPQKVELLTLVDRRFNRHLPVQPDYAGIVIDSLDEAYVRVQWAEGNNRDCVLMYQKK
jgi:pyrimidine operon attenuation protein/uracil phosphoribosyltransferase